MQQMFKYSTFYFLTFNAGLEDLHKELFIWLQVDPVYSSSSTSSPVEGRTSVISLLDDGPCHLIQGEAGQLLTGDHEALVHGRSQEVHVDGPG